jgi:opacity protein-like surface antigen
MRKIVLFIACISTFVLNASAQRNEVAFVVGAKITPSTGSAAGGNQLNVDSTPAFEGNFATQLIHLPGAALHLEFPIVGATSSDVRTTNLTAIKSYSALFFTPALRLKLVPGSPISPWISAGGGLAHFGPSSMTQAGTTTNVNSTTKGAFEGGAGLDFHVPVLPLALRAEVRDFYTGRPNLSNVTAFNVRNNIFVGGGVVLRF